ncbi:hypothetical protein T07_7989 [Trichinella nelsoni]|uniref:Uncharacterized protein n=1 Tax=Trichinella nelsoni TaxID=6336 RepID=A0A0V0RRU9_9BILA|nr:hypothetical protein T07_7989 [Trichinella nelsoni]
MKLVPFATRVRMDVKAFPSRPSVPLLITNSIVHHCGLRHPMKLVPFATRVRMDVKAFPSRPSVPLLITNSQRRNSIHHTSLVVRVAISAFGEYFERVIMKLSLNEIAAFLGNYPLLNMFLQRLRNHVDTSSQSTTTQFGDVWLSL